MYSKWDNLEVEDEELDFLQRATDIEAKVRALCDGTLAPDDPSLRLADEEEEDYQREAEERKQRAAAALKTPEEQKVERARRRADSERKLRAKVEKKRAVERENWWFGVDVCIPVAGDEDVVSDEVKASRRTRWGGEGGGAKGTTHYAGDYAKWDSWLATPDDPVSVAERTEAEAKRQAFQDEKFEELNSDFCSGVRDDMAKREAAQRKKRARATRERSDGNDLFKAKNYGGALAMYERALKTAPWEVPTLTNIAQAHIKMSEWAEAAEFCARAIRVDPGCVKAYARRSLALRALGRWDEALADAETAAELDPATDVLSVVARRTSMQRDDAAEEADARAAEAAALSEASSGLAADFSAVERIAATLGRSRGDGESVAEDGDAPSAAAKAVTAQDLITLQLLQMRGPTMRVALRVRGGVAALCALVVRLGAAHEARRAEAEAEGDEEIIVPGCALEKELALLAAAGGALSSACGNRRNAEIAQQSGALRTAAAGVAAAGALDDESPALVGDVSLGYAALLADCCAVESCAKYVARFRRGAAARALLDALRATEWSALVEREVRLFSFLLFAAILLFTLLSFLLFQDQSAMRRWAFVDSALRTARALAEHDSAETAAALSKHGAVATACAVIEATAPLAAASPAAARVREAATGLVARLTIVAARPAAAAGKGKAEATKALASQIALMSSDPAGASRALLGTLRATSDSEATQASALGALVNASLEPSGAVTAAICADGAIGVLIPLALGGDAISYVARVRSIASHSTAPFASVVLASATGSYIWLTHSTHTHAHTHTNFLRRLFLAPAPPHHYRSSPPPVTTAPRSYAADSMSFEMRHRALRLLERCSSCDAGLCELCVPATLRRLVAAFAAHATRLAAGRSESADAPAALLASSAVRAIAACVKRGAAERAVLLDNGGIEAVASALRSQLAHGSRSGNELLMANASSVIVACAKPHELRIVARIAECGVVDLLVDVVKHCEFESVKKNGCVALAKLAGDVKCSAQIRAGDGMRMLMDLGRKYC
jgi:tetratricopeptide (TPR) repeat protein